MLDPTAGDLPFLIVHGQLVWKVMLAAVAGAVLGLVWIFHWFPPGQSSRRRRRCASDDRCAVPLLVGVRSRAGGEVSGRGQ
jgi:hypothetical protein